LIVLILAIWKATASAGYVEPDHLRSTNVRTLVANSGASLLPAIQTAARAPGTVAEATPLASSAREQTANSEFATSVGSFNGQAPAETAPSVRLLVNFQLRQPDAALVWAACGNLIA